MRFALAFLLALAGFYLPDLYTHLDDRGYLTFGLPGPLPQAGGRPHPTAYFATSLSLIGEETIARRRDAAPLRLGEVFQGDARQPSSENVTFALRGVRLDADCAGAVWGQRLRAELRAGGCSQIVRGLYADVDSRLIGFIAILNMRDADAAERIVEDLDSETGAGFVLPLRGEGPLAHIGKGYSRSEGEAQGHFVFLSWVQRFDGAGPDSSEEHLAGAIRTAQVVLEDAAHALTERRLAD